MGYVVSGELIMGFWCSLFPLYVDESICYQLWCYIYSWGGEYKRVNQGRIYFMGWGGPWPLFFYSQIRCKNSTVYLDLCFFFFTVYVLQFYYGT